MKKAVLLSVFLLIAIVLAASVVIPEMSKSKYNSSGARREEPAGTPVPTRLMETPSPTQTPNDSGAPSGVPSPSDSGAAANPPGPVERQFPALMFQGMDMTVFNPEEYAADNGFETAVLNADGSMTVTMTQENYDTLLQQAANSIEETVAGYIGGKNTPYIQSVSHTQDYSSFTVDVDRAAYESAIVDKTPMVLGTAAMMYRVLSSGGMRTTITIRDMDTGQTIRTTTYPDDLAAQ